MNQFCIDAMYKKEHLLCLYKEVYGNQTDAYVIDNDSNIILIHYHITKIIPRILS